MQKETVSDIELLMKKKARRRLVGAIALVVLMMILLPFLLVDRAAEHKPSVKITLEEEVEPSMPSNEVTIPPTDFDSTITSAETPSRKLLPTEKPLEQSPVDNEEQQKPDSKPVTMDSEKVMPPVKTDMEPQKKVSGAYFVQVGVFSDPANVKQLQTKLSELGYASSSEKIQTSKGEKIRLRTQGFSSRNEAAIALQNIKDAGLTGMVVSQ